MTVAVAEMLDVGDAELVSDALLVTDEVCEAVADTEAVDVRVGEDEGGMGTTSTALYDVDAAAVASSVNPAPTAGSASKLVSYRHTALADAADVER